MSFTVSEDTRHTHGAHGIETNFLYCLVSGVNLTQARDIREEGASVEEIRSSCKAFSQLVINGGELSPLWVVPSLDQWSWVL